MRRTLIVFLSSIVITISVLSGVNRFVYGAQYRAALQDESQPLTLDIAYVFGQKFELMPTLHYQNIYQSMDAVTAADVLLMGNSRTGFGFRDAEMQAFSADTGLTIYNLGYGSGQSYPFYTALAAQHPLTPSTLVINVDGFFSNHQLNVPSQHALIQTPIAKMANQLRLRYFNSNLFNWRVEQLPVNIAWTNRNLLTLQNRTPDYLFLKSLSNGSWRFVNIPNKRIPATISEKTFWDLETLATAEQFLAPYKQIGADIVFVIVPSASTTWQEEDLAEFAQQLGAEYIYYDLEAHSDDLLTVDGSHLDAVSAQAYASYVFAELAKLESVE